ncbi:MAG: hypothetical protein QNJ81_07215 [Acidimicrobiia bacterium]|nr:hypothetical protein [Acidimicrobiia bacterium]
MAKQTKNFALVKALIPKLSPTERKELVVLITAGEEANTNARDELSSQLYPVIQRHLHKLQGKKPMPFNLLPYKTRAKVRTLQEQLDADLRRMMKGSGARMSRGMKVKFYMMYCEITSEAIIKNPDVPLSLSTLLNWRDRFLGLLDDAYPGYTSVGLIHVVMESINKR